MKKYKVYIKLIYRKSKKLKPFVISRVIDETHAKKVLRDNLKITHPNRRYELFAIDEINVNA